MQRNAFIRFLALVSRFGLAAIFLFAVIAKLLYWNDPVHSFVLNLSLLVGQQWAWPVAIAVIGAEALTAILLLVPRTVKWGGALAAIVLTVFAGYALYYRFGLHNSEGLECGCFGGIIASQLGVSTALRNLLLLIPAALVTFGAKKRPPRFDSSNSELPDAEAGDCRKEPAS
jgi:uncharacterized membrane protein YphA (DoxX/SURF4 family)